MAAEREDVRHVSAERRPRRGDDRQPAAEADAHQPDAPAAREPRRPGEPSGRALDVVGDGRRDREVDEVGDFGRHDRHAARGELAGERDQPRLVDAGGIEARHQQHGAPRRALPARTAAPAADRAGSAPSGRARSATRRRDRRRAAPRRARPPRERRTRVRAETGRRDARAADERRERPRRRDQRPPSEPSTLMLHSSNTGDCRLQIADCRLQIAAECCNRSAICNQSAI